MMTARSWLELLLSEVVRFADRSFQLESGERELLEHVRGWTPFWFSEDSCGLFDDARAREFLVSEDARSICTEPQLAKLSSFVAAADRFSPSSGDTARVEEHIDDPDWIEVTRKAAEALDAFGLPPVVQPRSPKSRD